jgi:hypothetical protein
MVRRTPITLSLGTTLFSLVAAEGCALTSEKREWMRGSGVRRLQGDGGMAIQTYVDAI